MKISSGLHRKLAGGLFRVGLFLVAITSFLVALILMKEGARPLAPLFRETFSVDSPASALGFGWISASLALSGSPVAATSLSLLDAQVLSVLEAYAMLSGSRLGASFVVLLIGFVYMLRGKQREISLGVGLTSLLVTQTLYPLVLALGFFMLTRPWLQQFTFMASQDINSPFDTFLQPLVSLILSVSPSWMLFPEGFLLVLLSLSLFDRAIPELNLQKSEVGMLNQLLYRPVVIFFLGAAITMLTMSVSVSLSLLVPLSVRGFVRLENVIPYILGANITTFVDTLIAAALLANPAAITIVMVQMTSVSFVSFLILAFSYLNYERLIQRLVFLIGRRRNSMILYLLLILGIPFLLVWLG